jgi:hypothetical protein
MKELNPVPIFTPCTSEINYIIFHLGLGLQNDPLPLPLRFPNQVFVRISHSLVRSVGSVSSLILHRISVRAVDEI